MTDDSCIYDELGVPRVINASGTKTRIGGSLIRPEAVEAMARASEGFVRLSDLQARASELIADATGADAGYVTNGAAAAMLLGTAACIAGDDVGVMHRLPDTTGTADEVVMARTHRTGYDHAVRTAGGTIVDIGTNDAHLGTGSSSVEPWELADAICEDTAAVVYVQKEYTTPPLETVVEIAHQHDVPVLVDAAAELPPKRNLSRFVEAGADLVTFSGGKAIRGPQAAGILAGRRDLIESVALQHLDMHAAAAVWEPPTTLADISTIDGVPRQGIGRPMKVGKEELVGMIRALELFLEEDVDALQDEWAARIAHIDERISDAAELSTTVVDGGKMNVAPELVISFDRTDTDMTMVGLVGALRRENPRVFLGTDNVDDGLATINPMCLTDDEAEYVAERVLAQVRPETRSSVSK